MPSSSRRSVLACVGSLSVAGLSGCTAFTDRPATLRRLTADLRNSSDTRQTFHVAIETAGGLGAWHAETVPADGERTVDIEPADDERPVALHGFVDDQPNRIDLDAVDFSGSVCLHALFDYRRTEGDPVEFALTADSSCS